MEINKTAKLVHENAKSKGFFDEPKNIGEMLCLIHSEVSEALEADRKDHHANLPYFIERMEEITKSYSDPESGDAENEDFKRVFAEHIKNSFEDELADVVIRVFDLAAFKGIDLERHIALKMRYNSLRPHKHGKKY